MHLPQARQDIAQPVAQRRGDVAFEHPDRRRGPGAAVEAAEFLAYRGVGAGAALVVADVIEPGPHFQALDTVGAVGEGAWQVSVPRALAAGVAAAPRPTR